MAEDTVPVRVRDQDGLETTLAVERGTVLRDALKAGGFEVYGTLSTRLNCGGNGLCGTCGVRVDPPPEPTKFHDTAAARFGYPRLSCQIVVEEPLSVEIPPKTMWGQLLPRRSGNE